MAEIAPDTIAVIAGNMSVATLQAVPGTFAIHILDLSPLQTAGPALLASHAVPRSGFLNGLTALPDAPGYILAADSDKGCFWRLNVYSGALDRFADPLFAKALNVSSSAINGIEVASHPRAAPTQPHESNTVSPYPALPPGAMYLYFSNSNTNIFGRIAILVSGCGFKPRAVVVLLISNSRRIR